MIIAGSSANGPLLGPSPQLRVKGDVISTDSSSIPAYLTLTIPSQTQVGDYIIIGTSNIAYPHSTSPINNWRSFYSSAGSGTYIEYTSTHVRVAQAGDAGSQVRLVAGPYSLNAIMDIFTNPKNSWLSTIEVNYGLMWRGQSVSTSNTTSIVRQTCNSPGVRPANYLRYTSFAANGANGRPTLGYSGSGTFRQVIDTYWWRAAGRVFETDSDDSTNVGTLTTSPSGAMASQSLLIP